MPSFGPRQIVLQIGRKPRLDRREVRRKGQVLEGAGKLLRVVSAQHLDHQRVGAVHRGGERAALPLHPFGQQMHRAEQIAVRRARGIVDLP